MRGTRLLKAFSSVSIAAWAVVQVAPSVASASVPKQVVQIEAGAACPTGATFCYRPKKPTIASGASVSIVDFAYAPASLSVSAGTTVVWTNTGNAPHSVTSDVVGQFDSSPNCPSPGPCLSPGEMVTHTFSAAGTFTYHCRVHP